MFDQLLKIFSDTDALKSAGDQFEEMLRLVEGMIRTASKAYWGSHITPQERKELQVTDIAVNKLQRGIRKEVILHLSGASRPDTPYGLLLMSLVKDAERLGDYAKNLAELHELCDRGAGDLPQGELTTELRRIADFVEGLSTEASGVYRRNDQARAQELALEGKRVSRACDALIRRVAGSGLDSAVAVDMALGTRYYKRIAGHLLNLLSSVLMPLHKLDYLDEKPPPSG